MLYIRCKKCFKILECPIYDQQILLEHIRTDHPEIDLSDNEEMKTSEKETPLSAKVDDNIEEEILIPPEDLKLPDFKVHMEETTIRSPDHVKPIYTRKYKITTPITPRSPQKRRMYRTSIEKWHPGRGVIYCPKCGTTKKPIIRSRSEKLLYSAVGAACILTCWPLCFLPCIFKPPSKDYLHCTNCKNFLGMYDKERNCVRPNREFIDGRDCEEETFEKSIQNNRQAIEVEKRSGNINSSLPAVR